MGSPSRAYVPPHRRGTILLPIAEGRVRSRAEFNAKVKELVGETETLAIRETIQKFKQEHLIRDMTDLDSLAECTFDIIMGPNYESGHTGFDAPYARLGETLSEIMVLLRLELPQFCSCGKKLRDNRCCLQEEEKPVTFTRILLNCVQRRFETLMKRFAEAEKQEMVTKELEHSLTACVTLIGRLYVRKLVAARVVAQVIAETIGVSERRPPPGCIRCVCELLHVVGQFMEDSEPGKALMSQFFSRIDNLAALGTPAIYRQDVQDIVLEMHRDRTNKWPTQPTNCVLLQYLVTGWLTAVEDWKVLQRRHALPPDEMLLEAPPGEHDEGEHLVIKSMISGRTIGVACSQDVGDLTAETFAELVSKLTGLHPPRIMGFGPDLTLLV